MKTRKFIFCKLSLLLLFMSFSIDVFSQATIYKPFSETQGRGTVNQIDLFPNPVLNKLQINYSKDLVLPLTYSVADCFGKVMMS